MLNIEMITRLIDLRLDELYAKRAHLLLSIQSDVTVVPRVAKVLTMRSGNETLRIRV